MISPYSAHVSWLAPRLMHQNGDIIGYSVIFSAANSDVVDTVYTTSNSTAINSLKPFTSYRISVAAVTRAGIGPYSIPTIILTDEAGI